MSDAVREKKQPPPLMQGLEFYLHAFQELLTERQIGEAYGPIPWSAIIRWAEFNGLTQREEIDKLSRYVRALEASQIKREREQRQKREKQSE